MVDDICDDKIVIHFPGGGLYYWWQHGALAALQEIVDLKDERLVFTGASCGSLSAAMAACNVDLSSSMNVAASLVEREVSESAKRNMLYDIFACKRKPAWQGLPFKWKMLLKEWLEVLLPSDAHKLASGRLFVQCQRCFPLPEMEVISQFCSKDDLISVLLASTHIPFFMDSNLSTSLRGKNFYVDGAMMRDRDSIQGISGMEAHVILDPMYDTELLSEDYTAFLNYSGIEIIKKYAARGKEYVSKCQRIREVLIPSMEDKTPMVPLLFESESTDTIYFDSEALNLSRSMSTSTITWV